LLGAALWYGLKLFTGYIPFETIEGYHKAVNDFMLTGFTLFLNLSHSSLRPYSSLHINEILFYVVLTIMLALYFLVITRRYVLKCDIHAPPSSPYPSPPTTPTPEGRNGLRHSQEVLRSRNQPVNRHLTCELLFFLFYGFSIYLQDTLLQKVVNVGCITVGAFYYFYYAPTSVRGPCPTVSEQFAESTQILIIIGLYIITYPYFDANHAEIPVGTLITLLGVFFFNTNNRLEKALRFNFKNVLHLTCVGLMAVSRVNHIAFSQATFPQLVLVFVQGFVFVSINFKVEAFYNAKLRLMIKRKKEIDKLTPEEVLMEYQTNRAFRDWVDQSVATMYAENYLCSAYSFWTELNLVFTILI